MLFVFLCVSFLRWMIRSDSIRYTLAMSEGATLLSEEIDAMLGVRQYMTSDQLCGQRNNRVNNGIFDPGQVGGPTLGSVHVNLRLQQLQQFSAMDTVTTYASPVYDEDTAMTLVATPNSRPDLAWIMPQTIDLMYPGRMQHHMSELTIVHMS